MAVCMLLQHVVLGLWVLLAGFSMGCICTSLPAAWNASRWQPNASSSGPHCAGNRSFTVMVTQLLAALSLLLWYLSQTLGLAVLCVLY
jgi:hypothetical protein